MEKVFIDYLMNGYDIHLNSLRSASGLLTPEAKDRVEIIMMRRVPGMKRRGGSAYTKTIITWALLRDTRDMEKVLKDLKGKVDITVTTKRET